MDKLIGFPTHERNTFCKEKQIFSGEIFAENNNTFNVEKHVFFTT
jgi:hypothetical protein